MQDYKLVIRSLSTSTVPSSGVESFSVFQSALNDQYLSQGYTILKVEQLSKTVVEGQPAIYEFAYHLVKEITKK
jgi:hypothetical protein